MRFAISLSAVMVFGMIIIAIVLEYMQKMEKIKIAGRQEGGQEVLAAIESLRQEVETARYHHTLRSQF